MTATTSSRSSSLVVDLKSMAQWLDGNSHGLSPTPATPAAGPCTAGAWPSGGRCKGRGPPPNQPPWGGGRGDPGWAGPFPWFEYHLNQTDHAQAPLGRN